MIINKQILEAHGVCGAGYDKFVELFGDGDEEYETCLAIVEELERVDPVNARAWVSFVRGLKLSAQFYRLQPVNSGGFAPRFRVFDPVSGSYSIATTLDEAKALRTSTIAGFLAHNSPLFTVSHAYVTDTGDEIWDPVSEADLV